MIKVYGASDDLIEIEGDIREEYYADANDSAVLKFSDGTEVSVKYADDGLWKVEVLKQGTSKTSIWKATNPESDDYSDILTIEGDIEWVTDGKEKHHRS